MASDKIYFGRGKLIIKAKGYWFTAGGGKDLFGFVPHLREDQARAFPVYSDTQILNVLRQAAQWSSLVHGDDAKLIKKVFGEPGRNQQSLLMLTDLQLDESSKKEWSDKRFEVKPRIQINEETCCVQNKMFGLHEMAFLDGLTLTSELFLGPFSDKESLEEVVHMVERATEYCFGFGAFRSRGCGGGDVFWAPKEPIEIDLAMQDKPLLQSRVRYGLTALVNLRVKPVDTQNRQTVPASCGLSRDKLRGWFVRAYKSVYGNWPSPVEMGRICFSDVYPCTKDVNAFPSPMTTLRSEGGDIRDAIDCGLEALESADEYLRVKWKHLDRHEFVSDEESPCIVSKPLMIRMRNQMEDDFVTSDEGLFAQEYLEAGTELSGFVTFKDPTGEFEMKAWALLNSMYPTVGGGLLRPIVSAAEEANEGDRFLVTSRVELEGDILARKKSDAETIRIGTHRRYNTMLNRPRRNRLVIEPGSVLKEDPKRERAAAWKGFGRDFVPQDDAGGADCISACEELLDEPKLPRLSRSQRGFLRAFLNPAMPLSFIESIIKDRIAKYDKKSSSGGQELVKFYEYLLGCIKMDDSGSALREYLERGLEEASIREYYEREERDRREA